MTDARIESRVLLRGEQTGGERGLVWFQVSAGWPGPTLHYHAYEESFYVLEGRLTFQSGDELMRAGPGGFVFARRGPRHRLHAIRLRALLHAHGGQADRRREVTN